MEFSGRFQEILIPTTPIRRVSVTVAETNSLRLSEIFSERPPFIKLKTLFLVNLITSLVFINNSITDFQKEIKHEIILWLTLEPKGYNILEEEILK